MNPIVVMVLAKAFPVLGTYSVFMLLTPVLMVIPFAAAEMSEKARDSRQARVWLLLVIVVIGLSGNLFGLYTNEVQMKECNKE